MELELLREIPGYKAILKSVLKAQIQLLVEQLCDQAGEESIILTASITDGSLSHMGSKMGKGFFEEKEEIKSQFLGYCLKRYHNRDSPKARTDYQHDQSDIYTQGPSGPKKQRFQTHPDDNYSPGLENQSGQNFFSHSVSNSSSMKRKTLQKAHASPLQSESLTTAGLDRNDNGHMAASETSIAAIGRYMDSASKDSCRTESDKTTNIPISASELSGQSGILSFKTQVTQDSDVSGVEKSGGSDPDTNIKIEPATEDEELEITGIEITRGASGVTADWAPDVSAEFGYQSGLPGEDLLNQSGSQYNDDKSFKSGTGEYQLSLNQPSDPTVTEQSSQDISHSCPICGQISASKYTLQTHIKTHYKLREFQCHLCDKQFTRKDSLKAHIHIHSGQKDHVCPYCGHAFFKKYNLKTHIHTIHHLKGTPKLKSLQKSAGVILSGE